MKIKRTIATDMRSAIRKVREEQGPNAVILGNRKVAEGIEILSADDADMDGLDSLVDDTELEVQGLAGTPMPGQIPKPRPMPRPQQAFERPSYERPQANVTSESNYDAQLRLNSRREIAAVDAPSLQGHPSRFEVDVQQQINASANRARQQDQFEPQPVFNDALQQHQARAYQHQSNHAASAMQQIDRERFYQQELEQDPHVHVQISPQATRAHTANNESQSEFMPSPSSAQGYRTEGAPNLDQIRSNVEPQHLFEPERSASAPIRSESHARPVMSKEQERVSTASAADYLRSQKAIELMRAEMQSLRLMMQNQMSAMDMQQLSTDNPIRLSLMAKLFDFGVGTSLARQLSNDVKENQDLAKAWRQALGLLANKIPIADANLMDVGGVVAMIGPTGVGKTTTIAKLAAKFAMRHGSDQVALISTDTYRVGAQEQLNNYARILGVSVKQADNQESLARALSSVMDRKLVLIDTAGASQHDMRLSEQFAELNKTSVPIKTYLTISATTQLQVVEDIVKAFADFELAGCVLTKLDEAYGVGAALTAMIANQIPVAYLGTGQRVPEDLQVARAHRLVGRAFEGVEAPMSAATHDADAMAARLREVDSHAD